ncbi:hypothetical protein [Arcobacter arenosus]|uniref:Uncharacterized protein n=1 Tax=Arcobacter arenosus TaxID=2576037 RepID=A0A5R8Y4C8_9BACT|nr:hypothetical protein [Arcobacter arenosus]TLP40640.1 hypothetical protein FDK22_01105 [Arcobacter arenosus]
MKNIILILVAFFVFIGCAPKEVVIDKKPVQTKKEEFVLIQNESNQNSMYQRVKENTIIEDNGINKIAILYPSRIVGKYAKSTISTISAFLIYNDKPFVIETFDTYDENPENILEQLNFLKEGGFSKVIAMFTSNGFNTLNLDSDSSFANFYFPLINKSEVKTQKSNFIFGGISYEEQLQVLETLSSNRNTMFYVKSYLGNKLKESYEQIFSNPGIIKEIERANNRYKYIMEDERIVGNTIIVNTPIVKTSIILSQLTAFEVNPIKVLSTQLNYNPLLIKLTQERDRENFFVVSSIENVDSFLEEYTKLLGGDVTYNWVDYSSLVGANYLLYSQNKQEEKSNSFIIMEEKNENDKELKKEIIKTKVIENQADYKSTLYGTTPYGFSKMELN